MKDLVVLGGESPTTPATAAVQGDCNLSSSTSSSSPLSTLSCLAPAPPSEALKPLKIAESMSPRLKAEHGGLYVEKGVGSPPRPVRVNSDVCLVDRDVQSDTEAEVTFRTLSHRENDGMSAVATLNHLLSVFQIEE